VGRGGSGNCILQIREGIIHKGKRGGREILVDDEVCVGGGERGRTNYFGGVQLFFSRKLNGREGE